MTGNRIALILAGVLLLAVGVIVYQGVSAPDVAPPTPIPTEPAHPWADVERAEADGVAFAVLSPGTGPSPKAGDLVEIDLKGWIEQTETSFVSTAGMRAVLGELDVVEGVARQLPAMKVGETRQIRVPAELGYGQTGRPPRIPRDAALVFELTLKEVAAPRAVPDAPPEATPDQETDGVQWVRLAEGRGEPPAPGRTARVHVTTWLADGARIDSTLERQRPIAVTVGKAELYPGLDAAIAQMLPGERRKLVVPPALAAGASGRGPIPPNSTLIFDVELVAVE